MHAHVVDESQETDRKMRSLYFVLLLQPANGGPPRFPTMASINASAPIALSFNPSNATALGFPFVPIGTAKRVPSELPWCIVESEDRPRTPARNGRSNYWQAAADRNERYARCHGYGFAYVEHTGGHHGKGCSHSVRGYLSPYWCKIPAVAHVIQNGINGRRCNRVVFLDSDVQIVNYSMSLDEYLEHGRLLGDEALIDDDWSLLFTSNAPHVNAGLCTGIFFARSKSDSCGILRNWWDANWPDKSRWSWEQGAMADGVHLHNRAYGARVRVLPTSHTWRAEDIPKLKKSTPPFRRDPLFYHRCSQTTGVRSKDTGNCAPPTAPDAGALQGYCSRDLSSARAEIALVKLPSAAMVFDEEKALERCPAATPRPGVMFASFMNASTCCNGSPLLAISYSLGWHCGGARPSKATLLVQCDRADERRVDMLDSQRTSGAFAVEVSGDQQHPPQPPAPQPTHTAQNIRLSLDQPRVRFGSDTRQGNRRLR